MLDDLQWCMHDALEWLHFLLRMDARSHLLVVGTVRTEEVDAEHPLTRLVEALRREDRVTEITLGRLSQQETAELATHLVGRVISEEQNAQLFTETEGNPLFIVEMIRAGPSAPPDRNADARLLNRPPAPVMDLPPVVQAIIARRLRQVTPSARVLLDVAAVIGRSFTYKVLARAASVDEDALLQGLDELWQRRIVRESGPEAYDFTHDKLRSVASMELSAARQRVLHRRVAEALEEEYHRNLDTYSGQLAVHFELAAMPAQAAHYYQRAALHARHLYANETALSYCNRALMLLGEDSQPPETTALYDQMAELLHLMGRYDEARDLWQRALELTPPSESVTQAQFYRKLGNAWRDQYHYD